MEINKKTGLPKLPWYLCFHVGRSPGGHYFKVSIKLLWMITLLTEDSDPNPTSILKTSEFLVRKYAELGEKKVAPIKETKTSKWAKRRERVRRDNELFTLCLKGENRLPKLQDGFSWKVSKSEPYDVCVKIVKKRKILPNQVVTRFTYDYHVILSYLVSKEIYGELYPDRVRYFETARDAVEDGVNRAMEKYSVWVHECVGAHTGTVYGVEIPEGLIVNITPDVYGGLLITLHKGFREIGRCSAPLFLNDNEHEYMQKKIEHMLKDYLIKKEQNKLLGFYPPKSL